MKLETMKNKIKDIESLNKAIARIEGIERSSENNFENIQFIDIHIPYSSTVRFQHDDWLKEQFFRSLLERKEMFIQEKNVLLEQIGAEE